MIFIALGTLVKYPQIPWPIMAICWIVYLHRKDVFQSSMAKAVVLIIVLSLLLVEILHYGVN